MSFVYIVAGSGPDIFVTQIQGGPLLYSVLVHNLCPPLIVV